MAELPHVDSFVPEDKDGLASPSKRENNATTGAAYEQARPTEPAKLDVGDPNFMADAYDTYADLRARGPVSRVRFAGGAEEAASEDNGEQQRGFFGSQETFFVTHYDEVVATLLDHRFAVDPRSVMSPE
jgi:hypothetical protein